MLTPVRGEGSEERGVGRASDCRAVLREPRQGDGEFWNKCCPLEGSGGNGPALVLAPGLAMGWKQLRGMCDLGVSAMVDPKV